MWTKKGKDFITFNISLPGALPPEVRIPKALFLVLEKSSDLFKNNKTPILMLIIVLIIKLTFTNTFNYKKLILGKQNFITAILKIFLRALRG